MIIKANFIQGLRKGFTQVMAREYKAYMKRKDDEMRRALVSGKRTESDVKTDAADNRSKK